ncbi:hypothetical protein Hypma_011139 [Hypsizygus marmoreus]|uniref:Uncharacterized protein n=1 Tax=Hypsizygus marmoreus TaxID=39966 RepID=A0A369JI91_HYPMA|nr:hypothetical protein Hypma_011139 [Hypsizygus marmoreus]
MADWEAAFTCYCGKIFTHQSGLSNHQHHCSKSKRRLEGALSKAKDLWNEKEEARRLKRRRLEDAQATQQDAANRLASGSVPTMTNGVVPRPKTETPEDNQASVDVVTQPETKASAPLPPAQILNTASFPASDSAHFSDSGSPIRRVLHSPHNVFSLFRQYYAETFPSHDPEEEISEEDLSDIPPLSTRPPHAEHADFGPYPNESSFAMGEWFWNSSTQKSKENFRELIRIITAPNFKADDLRDTAWDRIDECLGGTAQESWNGEFMDAGWDKDEVEILVPFHRHTPSPGPKMFVAGHLYHRSIIAIMRERLAKADSAHFHFEPYELYWQPNTDQPPMHVYGELYTSPAFIDAHNELQCSPPEPGCNLQRVVVGLMFASDETHLTSFGDAHLWPAYMFFGNDSKYRRCKPSCHLCSHVAYFEKLLAGFDDFYISHTGRNGPGEKVSTFCRRESFHAQWKIILNEEFMEAYKHESLLTLPITKRRALPCPRCLIPKSLVYRMGMAQDRNQRTSLRRTDNPIRRRRVSTARSLIYKDNYAIDSAPVERQLKETSLVPITNAFSECLSDFDFDLFAMMVIDLMHEIEAGSWRSLFIHLLRILECIGEHLVWELNRRFRATPSFGRDTIRRFMNNISELKQLAARDWEDMLQCAIPVFDSLLPEPHNSRLMDLLFTFALWHGLAKLRLHTDATLDLMDQTTTSLGAKMREFQEKTCAQYPTRELRREANARARRTLAAAGKKKGKKMANATSSSTSNVRSSVESGILPSTETNKVPCSEVSEANQTSTPTTATTVPLTTTASPAPASSFLAKSTPRPKTLKLNTYKYHAMGDYVATIRRYGTTDSYSTEPSELEHRTPKTRYTRTSKKDYVKQLTRIERRQAWISRIREHLTPAVGREPQFPDKAMSPELKYHIGKTQNQPEHILQFLQRNAGDPALRNFLPNLKAHLFSRIQELQFPNDASGSTHSAFRSVSPTSAVNDSSTTSILIHKDRMYAHKIVRFNYTTYDIRRAQDVINPNTPHCNIMMLAPMGSEHNSRDDGPSYHRFLYARVLGIFHVNVVYAGVETTDYNPRRLDFLWVRWYQSEPYALPRGGRSNSCRLDRLSFPPISSEGAFGFVNPADVLRACHIIPAFVNGMRHPDGQGISKWARDHQDFKSYFVNRFVDRDMLMRYHWGMGIGHTYCHLKDAGLSQENSGLNSSPQGHEEERTEEEAVEEATGNVPEGYHSHVHDSDSDSSDGGELGLRDREIEDLGSDSGEPLDGEDDLSDDETFIEMHDMYG